MVLLGIAYFAAFAARLDWATTLVVQESIYCLPIVATVVLGTRLALITRGVERRFWGFLTAANAVLLASELLLIWWIAVVNPAGPAPMSPPFIVLHLVSIACFAGVLVSMSRVATLPAVSRVRWTIDGVVVAAVAWIVVLDAYTRPLLARVEAPPTHVLLATLYPVYGLVVLVGTLGNIVGFRSDRWRAWDTMIVAALSVWGLGVILWPVWYTTVTANPDAFGRGLIDLIWFAAHWVLMNAVLYRYTEPHNVTLRRLPPPPIPRPRWAQVALPVACAVAMPLIGWRILAHRGEPVYFAALLAVAFLVAALLAVRSALVSVEYGTMVHHTVTDVLTGLDNHRGFHERIELEVAEAERFSDCIALIEVDIDDFRAYNDVHGFSAGDRLLEHVGALISAAVTPGSEVARLGGNRFGVVAPRTDLLEAVVLARRILDGISIEAGATPGEVTGSAGVAAYPTQARTVEQLLRVAEMALEEAKTSGKRRAVAFDDDRVPDTDPAVRAERSERENLFAAVNALAASVDVVDHAAKEHSRRVADLATKVSRRASLGESVAARIEMAALLHEVGTLGGSRAPAGVRAGVTAGRWAQIEPRFATAQSILTSAGLGQIAPAVRAVHEWWDGSGRPDGLAGEEIPAEARVLAVCDAYDTLVSGHGGYTPIVREAALAEIELRSGVQFEARLVGALRTVLLAEAAQAAKARIGGALAAEEA